MAAGIPFTKWTVHGNHFVIIDEVEELFIREGVKSLVARQMASAQYGIGCDDVLFIQSPSSHVLDHIDQWQEQTHIMPDVHNPEKDEPAENRPILAFRVFEPDGSEAAMCGDGLMAAAAYLYQERGVSSATFITGVSSPKPRSRSTIIMGAHASNIYDVDVSIGPTEQTSSAFVTIDCARMLVDRQTGLERLESLHNLVAAHRDILHDQDADELLLDLEVHWDQYLISCGEPHLVLVPKKKSPASRNVSDLDPDRLFARDVDQSSLAINRVGHLINRFINVFPHGINICFTKSNSRDSSLEIRSFERGLFRETFACGTGAIAVSAVICFLDSVTPGQILHVYPFLSQRHRPSRFAVEYDNLSWHLKGSAYQVFEGTYWPRAF